MERGLRLVAVCVLTSGFFLASQGFSIEGRAFVHLFEWRWQDVARECRDHLGPAGYKAVQVSPPHEHIGGDMSPENPWWHRYQPVSYQLISRGGGPWDFGAMVSACAEAGVDVYVDAVINHMTGGTQGDSGRGFGDSYYSHYNYPQYAPWDFHQCGSPENDIHDYHDVFQVRNCELSNLADLKTESPYVRSQIVGYLASLVRMGVKGFRIDAAKHMPPEDIAAIIKEVKEVTGKDFLVFQEVIDFGNEPIKGSDYFGNGMVTEFRYGYKLSKMVGQTRLHYLYNKDPFGEDWGMYPSHKAVVFVDNHDNQRGHGGGGYVLSYKNGNLYDLANIIMLAWPYGYPRIMSSYHFLNGNQGPPSVGGDSMCEAGFVCEHRRFKIKQMVAFRRIVKSAPVNKFSSNGVNQVAFSRGDLGFVAINREDRPFVARVATDLLDGSYCNLLDESFGQDSCPKLSVVQGMVEINIPKGQAVVLVRGLHP